MQNWSENFRGWKVHIMMLYLFDLYNFFDQGNLNNTDGENWWTTIETMLKNKANLIVFFTKLRTSIINWINMTRKFNKYCAWHTKTLDSCFDLIRSHQLCITYSPTLEIEPTTTECRIETLLLNYWSTSYTSVAKLLFHGKFAAS